MRLLRQLACLLFLTAPLHAQNNPQQLTLSGLLTQSNHGSFPAAKYAADGTLYLLLNQQDGIRILHADAGATTLLAQAHTGAAGDTPIAAALDPSGNLYVTGTTTSGTLSGTSGTPFPMRADTSTNSFLAKYDANLNLLWLTFLGAGRTSATALTATADAVFVTGLTTASGYLTMSALIPNMIGASLGFLTRLSATINTITSMSERGGLVALLALVLFPFKRKEPNGSNKRRYAVALVFLLLLLFALALLGCGGSKPGGKLLYTPAGTYQYQVTATTTSGPQLSHTVTLNLIVQ